MCWYYHIALIDPFVTFPIDFVANKDAHDIRTLVRKCTQYIQQKGIKRLSGRCGRDFVRFQRNTFAFIEVTASDVTPTMETASRCASLHNYLVSTTLSFQMRLVAKNLTIFTRVCCAPWGYYSGLQPGFLLDDSSPTQSTSRPHLQIHLSLRDLRHEHRFQQNERATNEESNWYPVLPLTGTDSSKLLLASL